MKRNILAIAGLTLSFMLFFGGCGVTALGERVDIGGPALTVTSPGFMAGVSGEFTLAGTAKDDSEVGRIEISLKDYDIKWRNEGMGWEVQSGSGGWTAYPQGDWIVSPNGEVDWSLILDFGPLAINAEEGEHEFTITSWDNVGNSTSNSKKIFSVVYDNEEPNLTVINPVLLPLADPSSYANASPEQQAGLFDGYEIKNPLYLGKIINQDFTLDWEIDDDYSPGGALTLELSGAYDAPFDGTVQQNRPVYFRKDFPDTQRSGSIVIHYDADSGYLFEKNDSPGAYTPTPSYLQLLIDPDPEKLAYLQVITTLYDTAGNREYKPSGWFPFKPEADEPWAVTPFANPTPVALNELSAYPVESTGYAYDDDGVKEVKWSVYEWVDEITWNQNDGADRVPVDKGAIVLASDLFTAKQQNTWTMPNPHDPGDYRLELEVKDFGAYAENGVKSIAYFNVVDGVSPTFVEINVTPPDTTGLFGEGPDGAFTINIKMDDDQEVSSLDIVWINPTQADPLQDLLSFISNKTDAKWADNFDLSGGNKKWSMTLANGDYSLAESTQVKEIYQAALPLTIFNTKQDDPNSLDALANGWGHQSFALRAKDNATPPNIKVARFSVSGDAGVPALTIEEVAIETSDTAKEDMDYKSISSGLMLRALDPATDKLKFRGTWQDDSYDAWENMAITGVADKTILMGSLDLTWNAASVSATVTLNPDGSWESAPFTPLLDDSGKVGTLVNLAAYMTDKGGNEGTAEVSFRVDTANPEIQAVSSLQSSGRYGEGSKIEIIVEFNKAVEFPAGWLNTANHPVLNLNNGQKARYVSGNETNRFMFEYTVGSDPAEDTEYGNTANTSYNSDGDLDIKLDGNRIGISPETSGSSGWHNLADPTNGALLNIPENYNLTDKVNIIIDTTKPEISRIHSNNNNLMPYGPDKIIYITVYFNEDVTIIPPKEDTTLPWLFLNSKSGAADTGRPWAAYVGQNSSNSALFSYKVGPKNTSGENVAPLDVEEFYFGSTNKAEIKDLAGGPEGNKMDNTAPPALPKDAGNTLASAGLTIDTTPYGAPVVTAFDGFSGGPINYIPGTGANEEVIPRVYEYPYFVISGIESDAVVMYSLNAGTTWQRYTGTLSSDGSLYKTAHINITANNDYVLTVRQTDPAQNVSEDAEAVKFKVTKQDFLSKISASKSDGLYTWKADGDPSNPANNIYDLRFYFSSPVYLKGGTPLTDNGGNFDSAYPKIKLNVENTKSGSAAYAYYHHADTDNRIYYFRYIAKDGDKTPDQSYLDVYSGGGVYAEIDWGSSYMADAPSNGIDVNAWISVKKLTGNNTLSAQKKIQIVAGVPKLMPNGVKLTPGTGGNATLEFEFDRPVVKASPASGLTIIQAAEGYRIPTVIDESRFNALYTGDKYVDKDAPGATPIYTITTNGTFDEGATPDLNRKWVLDYAYNADGTLDGGGGIGDATLKDWFRGKEKIEIPAMSNQVTISSGNSNKIVVSLSGSYKLPVMGAEYEWALPEGFVEDHLGNLNAATSFDDSLADASNRGRLDFDGVEAPSIRVKLENETFSGTGASRIAAQPVQTDVKIDGRTPGSTLRYWVWEYFTDPVSGYGMASANDAVNPQPRLTVEANTTSALADLPVPKTTTTGAYGNITTSTSASASTRIGSTRYDTGGQKIRVRADAQLDGAQSAYAYETAYRSVLVFWNNTAGVGGNPQTYAGLSTNQTGRSFTGDDINRARYWVRGGDSTSGAVSTPGFPISWNESEDDKVRCMTPRGTYPNNNYNIEDSITTVSTNYGQHVWYWVTWQLRATAYVSVIRGTTQNDTDTYPYKTSWPVNTNGWSSFKQYYPLFPGETRVLKAYNATYRGTGEDDQAYTVNGQDLRAYRYDFPRAVN